MDMFSLGNSDHLVGNEYNREPGLQGGSERASQQAELVSRCKRNHKVTAQKQRQWFLKEMNISVRWCGEGQ